jgi:Fe-S cluster assembly ATP-binding protein
MGPNGSGKSTLAYALAGHPRYEITGGTAKFAGQDLAELEPDERAKLGLFLAMQYPVEVPGVSVMNFLRTSLNAIRGEEMSPREFIKLFDEKSKLLGFNRDFADRYLNEGFSGGEKKRHEILQMAMLEPKFAVLDETDSGLDVDALRVVSEGVNTMRGPDLGVLIITHYTRILRYITPDVVHVMFAGRIARTGGPELAEHLEENGYVEFGVAEEAAAPAGS